MKDTKQMKFYTILMILGPAGIYFSLVPCSLRNPCFFQEAVLASVLQEALGVAVNALF